MEHVKNEINNLEIRPIMSSPTHLIIVSLVMEGELRRHHNKQKSLLGRSTHLYMLAQVFNTLKKT